MNIPPFRLGLKDKSKETPAVRAWLDYAARAVWDELNKPKEEDEMIEIRVNSGVIEYRFIVDQVRRQWSGWHAAAVVNPEVPKAVDLSRDALHAEVVRLRAEYNAMHKTAVGLLDNRDFWKEVAARRKERGNYLAEEMRKYREEAKALHEELDRAYARIKHTDAVLLQSRRASAQLREELELARKALDQAHAMLTCNDATRDMLYASRSRKNDLLRQCRGLLAHWQLADSPTLKAIDAELARKD
jgi:hypothetical protein